MSGLILKDKDIAVPGEVLAEGMDFLPGKGAMREGDKIIALRIGLINIDGRAIKLIPLSGRYMPKKEDVIIGQIADILFHGWKVDTFSAYQAMLSMKDATSEYIARGADLTRYYDLGDYIIAEITNVTSQKLADLSMKGPNFKKLVGGRIFMVNSHKVPRIIGKQGSMISMIKQATNCRIVVGQNGVIWIDGEPKNELIAVEAIKKIERESHLSGLTDKISDFLEKVKK